MKQFTSPNQKIGLAGENEAELFLVKQRFTIVERNFSSKLGEIDLIAQKREKLHFIEVKSITVPRVTSLSITDSTFSKVSRETPIHNYKTNVSRETFLKENRKIANPFQNISVFKIRKLTRTILQYLKLHNLHRETKWQCDGIGVYLNQDLTLNKIEYIEHITIR